MNKKDLHDFSDLEDDFNSTPTCTEANLPEKITDFGNQATFAKYVETCKACKGSGQFVSWAGRVVGPCFKCDGKGEIAYKTSPEQRAKGRVNAQKAKDRKQVASLLAAREWGEANPAEWKWISDNAISFDFARSLSDSLTKYGSLTDGQMGAVRKCIARNAERDAQRAQRAADAPVIDISPVLDAMNKAKSNGKKKPILRTTEYRFSFAPASGKNAGCLYVTSNAKAYDDRVYYGKIDADGKFFKARDFEGTDDLVKCVANLDESVIAYGKETKQCGCCGYTLTNPISIDRGIGPICWSKFFG